MILRAGPFATISDSFRSLPSTVPNSGGIVAGGTTGPMPVNCANGDFENWPFRVLQVNEQAVSGEFVSASGENITKTWSGPPELNFEGFYFFTQAAEQFDLEIDYEIEVDVPAFGLSSIQILARAEDPVGSESDSLSIFSGNASKSGTLTLTVNPTVVPNFVYVYVDGSLGTPSSSHSATVTLNIV